MPDEHVFGIEKPVNFAEVLWQADLAGILELRGQELGLQFLGQHDVLEGHEFLVAAVEFGVEQTEYLLLLVQIFVDLPAVGLADQLQNTGFVNPFVMLLFKLQIAERVSLNRQVVVADFLQQRLDHLLVLVKQVVDIFAQFVVEKANLFLVVVELGILSLPLGGKLLPDLLDVLDGRLGVLMHVGLLASLAEQEVLLAFVIQANVLVGLLVGQADLLSVRLVHLNWNRRLQKQKQIKTRYYQRSTLQLPKSTASHQQKKKEPSIYQSPLQTGVIIIGIYLLMANGVNTEWFDLQVKFGNYLPKQKEQTLAEIQKEMQEKHAQENKIENRLDKKSVQEIKDLEDDLDFDDEFMRQYMNKRKAELLEKAQRHKYGQVIEISRDEYVREVTQANPDDFVVLHLYQNSNEFCLLINERLPKLAAEQPHIKFVKIVSTKCIEKFPDDKCPCFIVYKAGKPVLNLVNVDVQMDKNVNNMASFLKAQGVDIE